MGISKRELAVTVDVALMTMHQGRFSILLVLRSEPPWRDRWGLPGSFVGAAEDLDAAARRALQQETGIEGLPDGVHLERLRSYGDPRRDPRGRVVSVAYVAFAANLPAPRAGQRVAAARLVPIAELAAEVLAFDHARIVEDAVERARTRIEYSAPATAFLDEPFSLSDLRAVYEEVWGLTLDPSNFRRKVLRVDGFLTAAGAARTGGPSGGRPARLYRRGPRAVLWPPLRRSDPCTVPAS